MNRKEDSFVHPLRELSNIVKSGELFKNHDRGKLRDAVLGCGSVAHLVDSRTFDFAAFESAMLRHGDFEAFPERWLLVAEIIDSARVGQEQQNAENSTTAEEEEASNTSDSDQDAADSEEDDQDEEESSAFLKAVQKLGREFSYTDEIYKSAKGALSKIPFASKAMEILRITKLKIVEKWEQVKRFARVAGDFFGLSLRALIWLMHKNKIFEVVVKIIGTLLTWGVTIIAIGVRIARSTKDPFNALGRWLSHQLDIEAYPDEDIAL